MSQARLGIIDWGIGGLGLLGRLDALVPALPVVYWSDTGSVPYGLQPTGALAARLRSIVVELADRGCTEVVLACNAASTVVDRLGTAALPVAGVIAAGIASVPSGFEGTIGVVGGRRTIRSGAYRRALQGPGRVVVSRVAQPLSAHIEAGRTGSVAFAEDLRSIVAPMAGADALILACTHYPAARSSFAEALPGTRLLDPAEHLAGELAARLGPAFGDAAGERAERTICTTGDATLMQESAAMAWGMALPTVERVS